MNFSARIVCQDFSRCSAVVGGEKWPWTSIQSFDMFMERAGRKLNLRLDEKAVEIFWPQTSSADKARKIYSMKGSRREIRSYDGDIGKEADDRFKCRY